MKETACTRRPPRLRFICLIVLALTVPVYMASAQTLPRLGLKAGAHHIEAEVAATSDARAQGLMNRKSLPANSGMLFVFPETQLYCMWMHNTYVPLSVAFLDDTGKIVNIVDMQPLTEDSHCAAIPVRLALEMKLGWFREKGIGPGVRIRGIEQALPGR